MGRRPKAAPDSAKPAKYEVRNKLGRKLAISDREMAKRVLGGLGAIHATWKEAAAVLQVDENTLRLMFNRWPDVKDAYEAGKLGGNVSLRRGQFKLAERNATMSIFLGMNYLDQKDMRNFNHSGTVKHTVEHSLMGIILKEIDAESRGTPVIEHKADEKAA